MQGTGGAGDGLEPLGRRLGALVPGAPQQGPGSCELVQLFEGRRRGAECQQTGNLMTRDREPSSKNHIVLIRHKEESKQSQARQK